MVYIPERFRKGRHLKGRWGVARTGQVSKQGTVELWEHWDGSVDAVAKPAAMGIRMKAISPSGVDSGMFAEFEAAVREHETALRSKDSGWIGRTTQRVNRAKERLAEKG